jgi:hypothetical protein
MIVEGAYPRTNIEKQHFWSHANDSCAIFYSIHQWEPATSNPTTGPRTRKARDALRTLYNGILANPIQHSPGVDRPPSSLFHGCRFLPATQGQGSVSAMNRRGQ